MILKKLLRTIPFGIVLFSLSSFSISVKNKSQSEETYKDIISKAKNLALQNDRIQALNILQAAVIKENPKSVAQAELRKNFNDLSNVFFSDHAQQMYELAISMMKTEPQMATSKISDALRVEPDNFLILTALVRLKINRGDCGGAAKELVKYLKFKNVSEELLLASNQVNVCLGDFKAVEENKQIASSLKSNEFLLFWKLLELESVSIDSKKMNQILDEIAKIDGNYPEISYWRWKNAISLKKKATLDGANYLLLCKNLSSTKYRQYMMDPNLCKRVQEVEKTEN